MEVTYVSANEGEWLPSPDGAGRYRILRLHSAGGITIEVSMDADTEGDLHRHPGGEELLMVEGLIEVGGITLGPGDYLFTPPGATHRACARSDARFVLFLPAVPEYL
ncbi:MAG: cupin domain-containing protein [Actinomycetes bacterium]